VSGKRKQNTIKTTTISDGRGRTLWSGAVRPGRMHDQTAVRTEGIEALLHQYPTVTARVDTGYRGLAKTFPDRVCAPPLPPAKDASDEEVAAYKQARNRQSSGRICVEHAIAEHKQWRPLQRYLGRREAYAETHLAIAGLVSDRAARRP
jgi:DDE superfamily endonuclease